MLAVEVGLLKDGVAASAGDDDKVWVLLRRRFVFAGIVVMYGLYLLAGRSITTPTRPVSTEGDAVTDERKRRAGT